MINLNTIYNEDCMSTMERMDEKSVDLIMTSPPYNMVSKSHRRGGISDTGRYDGYKDDKTEEEYVYWTIGVFNDFDRIVKNNGVVLYNFSYSIDNPSLPYKLISEITKTDWTVVDTIIWKKACGLPFPANERRLSRNWEYVFVFARKSEVNTFNCYKGVKSISEKTGQNYYNIFYNFIEARNNDGKTHGLNQATYSTELCTKLFNIYADKNNPDFIVYDPFMGTGTTAAACKEYGISYIGSEISKNQCEYAENRIKNLGN